MKQKQVGEWRNAGAALKHACVVSCRKIVAQLRTVKESLFNESRRTLDAEGRLVRLALNEAEALAWQTAYPHLVFPVLATEKVQAVAAWNAHQRVVRPALAVSHGNF